MIDESGCHAGNPVLQVECQASTSCEYGLNITGSWAPFLHKHVKGTPTGKHGNLISWKDQRKIKDTWQTAFRAVSLKQERDKANIFVNELLEHLVGVEMHFP